MREVYLIRHAEAVYDRRTPDAHRPLSPRGLRQAEDLVGPAARLGIEEIHCSPYARCRQTIMPVARRLGLVPSIVEGIRERLFTQSHVEDWTAMWKKAWLDPDFACTDGESGRQAQTRMHAAVIELVSRSNARTLAVSSHGNVIALLLQRIEPAFDFHDACAIRNPDVLRVTYDGAQLTWDRSFRIIELDAFATVFGAGAEE